MTCSQRWCLVIDPQLQVPHFEQIGQNLVPAQGIVWIKNKEAERNLQAAALEPQDSFPALSAGACLVPQRKSAELLPRCDVGHVAFRNMLRSPEWEIREWLGPWLAISLHADGLFPGYFVYSKCVGEQFRSKSLSSRSKLAEVCSQPVKHPSEHSPFHLTACSHRLVSL